MRAAMLEEHVSVEEIMLDPPGPGEVRVRITAAGVCRTDLHIIETGGWGMPLPVVLGHEAAGVVEELGDGVAGLEQGDVVVLAWRSPCGRCAACLRGDARRCRSPLRAKRRAHRRRDGALLTPALLLGTFATHVVVHAGQAIKVPPELPPEQACLIGCAVATGVGAALNTSPVWPGARVAVIGCGAVGLCVVQGARLAGAAEIVAVDFEPRKREAAGRFGATEARGPDELDDLRVDFAFEAVGRPETVELAVHLLDHAGIATVIGVPKPGTQVGLDLAEFFDTRAQLRVSHGGDHVPAEDFPLLARLALDGKLDLAGMVTRTIALEDVEDAFAEMAAGNVIRSVILP